MVHWIDLPIAGRLAIMARPRAGEWLDDEISGWRREGIEVVVSLLEAHEAAELGLEREAELCGALDIELISYPIQDRGVPASLDTAASAVRAVAARMSEGKAVAIHCRAGIGRSGMFAACILVLLGYDPDAAFKRIGEARGVDVPDTEAQRDWVRTVWEGAAKRSG